MGSLGISIDISHVRPVASVSSMCLAVWWHDDLTKCSISNADLSISRQFAKYSIQTQYGLFFTILVKKIFPPTARRRCQIERNKKVSCGLLYFYNPDYRHVN